MKIERGIPIPPPNLGGGGRPKKAATRVPWIDLKVGDSVLVKCPRERLYAIQIQLATSGRRVGDLRGAKFTTRRVEDGVRVWRVE